MIRQIWLVERILKVGNEGIPSRVALKIALYNIIDSARRSISLSQQQSNGSLVARHRLSRLVSLSFFFFPDPRPGCNYHRQQRGPLDLNIDLSIVDFRKVS